MDQKENLFLNHCKHLIEKKFLHQAGISSWKQKDLEYLSEKIDEKCGVVLSLSTLKRIWKKDFSGTPHPTTLNALVSILGYKNWWEFKSSVKHDLQDAEDTTKRSLAKKSFIYWAAIPGIFILLLIALGPTLKFSGEKTFFIPDKIPFNYTKTVSSGVPATVLFDYDVSEVVADSFFIQQSWNDLFKESIDPENNTFSSIYYMPGFHKAKLIANDSIIKIDSVHITTDGWISCLLYDYGQKTPIYFKDGPVYENGAITIPTKMYLDNHVNLDRFFVTNYINIRPFGQIESSDFELTAALKCERDPTTACPTMNLVVHTEKHIFYIPISTIGCVHNNIAKIGEKYLSGRDYDLSKFSADVFEWQEISLKVKNRNAKVFLNDKLIETISFTEDHGNIVGLTCRFIGSGSVDFVRLVNPDGHIVYEDNFDQPGTRSD